MKGQYTGMGSSSIQPGPRVVLTAEEKAYKKRLAKARATIRKLKDLDAEKLAKTLTEHMKLDDDKPLA